VLAVFVRFCADTSICVAGLWRIPHVAEPRVDSQRSYGHNVTCDLRYARQHVATILLTTTASNDAHNQRTDTIMVAHTLRSTALAAIAIGMAAAASIHANTEAARTQYVTFSGAVALPGVTLHSGTYIFELADPDAAHDIVRVMSRDRRTIYLSAFTREIPRPSGMPLTQLVSMREPEAGAPAPITVWWSEAQTGRQFIYTR